MYNTIVHCPFWFYVHTKDVELLMQALGILCLPPQSHGSDFRLQKIEIEK